MKKKNKSLPTGQVMAVLGLSYRTIYNYLRDYGDSFSESARSPKKGKRWTPGDLAALQTIRHLHSERCSREVINQALADGYIAPLEGQYKPEDINRLIEASWLMLQDAQNILAETKKQFTRCEFCEWDLRYHIQNGFYETIFRYEEFEHELNQIKLVVGRISDSNQARQMRDDEYRRLHAEIRYKFLAEEERRIQQQHELEGVEVENAKARLVLVHDKRAITKWIYDLLPRREKREPDQGEGDKIDLP